jgi:hypothetical protein
MHGPITTAGKIDAFETRFTIVNGAHFLIALNGKEAWPISAAEADAFKALYRRRMQGARWRRRWVFIVPFGLLFLSMAGLPVPDTLAGIVLFLYLIGIPIAFAQHEITSDLTKRAITRPLKQRMTTRFPAAITPVLTPLGRFGRRLLLTAVVLEIGLPALHLCFGRESLAAQMRVMHGMTNGREGLLAEITGTLAWVGELALVLAVALIMIDRAARRRAARASPAPAPPSETARARLLHRLAAQQDGTPLAEGGLGPTRPR